MNRNNLVERTRRFVVLHQDVILVALMVFLVVAGLSIPTRGGPIENLTGGTGGGIGPNQTNYSAYAIEWGPETGFYTRYWFNTSRDIFDPFGLFYSLFLPIASITGWGWMFFTMWGSIVTAFYLYTEETTMPFVIGIFAGAVLSYAMTGEQVLIMILIMVFLGGGILTKAILGRR